MVQWKKVKIGSVCETISKTYKGKDDKVILVNTSDVLEGKILNHNKVDNKNLKGQFKKTFQKNDILYSEIRPANKRFAFVDIEDTDIYIASTKLMVLRPDVSQILPKFLFAILKSNSVIEELQHLAETRSGTFPQITFSTELAPMEISLPDLDTQAKILSVLDSIEGKIDNNLEINRNLEEQAQALYEEFYKINAPEISLSEMIDVKDGTHDSPKAQIEGYPLVTSKHLYNYGVDKVSPNKITKEDFDKINIRSKVDTGDVMISMIGTVGIVSYVYDKTIDFAIKNVGLFKTSGTKYGMYVLFYLKSSEMQNYIMQHLAGTTQKYISLGELRKLPIKNPEYVDIEHLNNILGPLISSISSNLEENKRLSNLRDTLLPKLMSGELDVSEIDI